MAALDRSVVPSLDRNCLSYWFPRIKQAGLPVPETQIIRTDLELVGLLDGEAPSGWETFLDELSRAADVVGYPLFLRTGQGSGKHSWAETCFVTNRDGLAQHVFNLVEWSFLVDLFGLPVDVWIVRRMIQTRPLFTAFRGMPITREFRFFVRDGSVTHIQPYWPPEAISHPSVDDWRPILEAASTLTEQEGVELSMLALRANEAVPGYWSVDFLQGADGKWWLTDMALGDGSYRWEP